MKKNKLGQPTQHKTKPPRHQAYAVFHVPRHGNNSTIHKRLKPSFNFLTFILYSLIDKTTRILANL
jgi:hypothetical protein